MSGAFCYGKHLRPDPISGPQVSRFLRSLACSTPQGISPSKCPRGNPGKAAASPGRNAQYGTCGGGSYDSGHEASNRTRRNIPAFRKTPRKKRTEIRPAAGSVSLLLRPPAHSGGRRGIITSGKLRGGVPNTWHIPLLPQKLQLFPFWQRLYFPFQTQRAPLIRAGRACGQPHGAPRPCASGPSGQFPVMLPDPAFHVGTYPAVQAAIRTAQQIDMPDPFLHVLPVSRNGTKINPHLSGARESGLSPGHSAAGHACRRTS